MTDVDRLMRESGITDPESLEILRAELEKNLGDSINNAIWKGRADQAARAKKKEVDAEVKDLTAELEGMHEGLHGSMTNIENRKRVKEITAKINRLSPPVQT